MDRLKARRTKLPFVEIKQPEIHFAFLDETGVETGTEIIETVGIADTARSGYS